MNSYRTMTKQELLSEREKMQNEYEKFAKMDLKLDMSRGKPGSDQLDLSNEMLAVKCDEIIAAEDGFDLRNYGILDGIPEAKKLFSDIMDVDESQIIVAGNSSLNLMYDAVMKAMLLGVKGGEKPWSKGEKVKFLCPSPGYDRHFAICENLGIEMVTVPMQDDGPDMEIIENLVSNDESIKGIWCVPLYSNPTGISYSDEKVRRFAGLKPAARDFRIFWDNAYCIHSISEKDDKILNLIDECEKAGNPDIAYVFASTSKITFPGAGVAVMCASKGNIDFIKAQMAVQTIGHDKLNQRRHVRFFKDKAGVFAHMKRHKSILAPKFAAVLSTLDREVGALEIASYNRPNGGYFVSVDVMDGCAKRVVSLCKEAGVVLTPAGATFPYGADPQDANIRLAPTYPSLPELEKAMEIFCVSVKLASLEKLTANA